MAPFQNASPLVFIDESMPFDTVRMAGELTAQFAAGPSFKEGPLGFDGIGGVAIAVLDLPRTMVDLFMRQSSLGEFMLPSECLDCGSCCGPGVTDEDVPL